MWNKLPYTVRYAAKESQFKTRLKTTLFLSAPGLKLLNLFVSVASRTPPPPPHLTPISCSLACIDAYVLHACLFACVCVCVCVPRACVRACVCYEVSEVSFVYIYIYIFFKCCIMLSLFLLVYAPWAVNIF